jgi:ATP-dependent protease HslVU (ClpYQ) peptidase subunit
MGREILLKQKKELDDAMKEVLQKYKEPCSLKCELKDESGAVAGYVEYMPSNDTFTIIASGSGGAYAGGIMKSLKEALEKLL